MGKKMLDHLESQLAAAGIASPDAIACTAPTALSSQCVNLVSGGFGQIVGFGQYFSQTSGPGYVQNHYNQYFGNSSDPE